MQIKGDADFGKRECPSCAVVVDSNQNYCPICKYAFPHPTRYRKIGIPLVAGVLIIVIFLVVT